MSVKHTKLSGGGEVSKVDYKPKKLSIDWFKKLFKSKKFILVFAFCVTAIIAVTFMSLNGTGDDFWSSNKKSSNNPLTASQLKTLSKKDNSHSELSKKYQDQSPVDYAYNLIKINSENIDKIDEAQKVSKYTSLAVNYKIVGEISNAEKYYKLALNSAKSEQEKNTIKDTYKNTRQLT